MNAAIDFGGQLAQGQHLGGQASLADGAGHAPDDAAGFVLGQHLAAGFVDALAAAQPVRSPCR